MARGPLAVFRKHQKKLLAFFGVAIMIAFLLPSAAVRFFNSGPANGAQNDVVVQWSEGALNENEMYALRTEHGMLLRILFNLTNTADSKGGTPNVMGLVRDPRTNLVREPGISIDNSGRALLQTVLLANRAKRLGLIVDDQTIQQFLGQLTGGVLSPDEIRAVARASSEGMNEFQLFHALRRYLSAQKVILLAVSGMRVGTPGENWDYYNRLQRRITAEIKALPVSNFIDQVEEPSDAEIKRLYSKHKDEVDNPADPEPGFKRPARVALDFLAADMLQFRVDAERDITDDQILAFYKENKDDFKRREPPPGEENESDTDDSATEDDEASTDEDSGASSDTDGSSSSPQDIVDPAFPGNEPHQDSDPRQTLPRPPTPETDESAEIADPRQVDPQPPVPSEHEQSFRESASAYELALGAAGGSADHPVIRGQSPEDDLNADDLNADLSNVENDDAEAAGADEIGTDIGPETESAESGEDRGTVQPNTSDLDMDFGLDSDVTTEPDYGHYELEEVADEIRRNLAIPVARAAVEEEIKQVKRVMRKYFDNHRLWLANQAQGLESPAPELPDFQQLADEHGLTAGSIPLTDMRGLATTHEIGRAQVIEGQNARPIAESIFGSNLLPFMPKDAFLYDMNTETEKYYLFWKNASEEERVPEFEEVRDEVIQVWKAREAVALAQQEAERLADELNKSGKKLSDIDAETATEVGPFSWYTLVNMSDNPMGQFFLTPVTGVDQIGAEFMRGAFSLKVGEAGTAINRTQSVIYVVQIISEDSDPAVRQKAFFDSLDESGGLDPQLMRIAEIERRELLRNWYMEMENELEVVWNRPPDATTVR